MKIACPKCEHVYTLSQATIDEILETGTAKFPCVFCQRSYTLPKAVIDRVLERHRRPPDQPEFFRQLADDRHAPPPLPATVAKTTFRIQHRTTHSFAQLVLFAAVGLFALLIVLGLIAAAVNSRSSNELAGGLGSIGVVLIVGVMSIGMYLGPTWIAVGRRHHNSGAIAAVNILFGWTVLGWCVALIWSLTAVPDSLQGSTVTTRMRR